MSRSVADHAEEIEYAARTVDAAIAPILSEIEQEKTPERLLDLARQLQNALALKRGRDFPT